MTFTRSRDLIAVGVIGAVLVNLLLQTSYGDLPLLPQPAGITLLAFAAVEAVLGTTLRARIQRKPGTRPVQALSAAKAVALAKASSLAGSITFGAWLGVLTYVLPLRDQLQSAASDTVTASIGAVCAGALVAAALWLEHCCRNPDFPDGQQADDRHSDDS